MSDVGARLAGTLLHLVNIESVSRNEGELTAWITDQARARGLEVAAAHRDWLVFGPPRAGRPLIVLAGHSDTVPVQQNLPGRIDGGAVRGLGASDMKGSLAVMLELCASLDASRLAYDLACFVFGHEELPLAESLVPGGLAGAPMLAEAELVVMMEPTANQLHAGCLGNIAAELVFEGVAAHSARPWLGRNAIHEAVRGLRRLVEAPIEEAAIDGLVYREVVSVTTIQGGVANNVIPDRAGCGLNFRYSPRRSPSEAEERLRELTGPDGRLTVVSNAPGALPALANRALARLREVGEMRVEPKQAWTPVAEFAQAGLAAVNYGPGDPAFAHRRDERVEISALVESFDVLIRWLCR